MLRPRRISWPVFIFYPFNLQDVSREKLRSNLSLKNATQIMETNPIKTAITVCSQLIKQKVRKSARKFKTLASKLGYLTGWEPTLRVRICDARIARDPKVTTGYSTYKGHRIKRTRYTGVLLDDFECKSCHSTVFPDIEKASLSLLAERMHFEA